jgi:hypothetical protein
MKKWNVPLTYEPKIEPVQQGKIRQTIRIGRKYSVGDLIRFYVWEGKPYRSKRHNITGYMPLIDVEPIVLFPIGIAFPKKWDWTNHTVFFEWDSAGAWNLSTRDGIVPPTGEALRDVLISKNGEIPKEGIETQIIRW